MKYYLAYLEIPYEGIFEPSIKLFDSKQKAAEYIEELKKEYSWADCEIKELEIE